MGGLAAAWVSPARVRVCPALMRAVASPGPARRDQIREAFAELLLDAENAAGAGLGLWGIRRSAPR
jgi:hypothetical protein